MRLVKPSEVSGKIMTIIDEARDQLVIVSPYNKFRGWKRLEMVLRRALNSVKDVQYYTRQDDEVGNEFLKDIGVSPILVPRLHAKLYFNEHSGVVSSMNLLRSSEDASIEIAFETENQAELDSLREFHSRYLLRYHENPLDEPQVNLPNEINDLYAALAFYLERGVITSGLPPLPVRYRKRRDSTKYQVGRRDFELSWHFENPTLWVVCTMVLSGRSYEYLAPRLSGKLDMLLADASINDPGAGYHSNYKVDFVLPERKLKDCSRRQVAEVAQALADALMPPLVELANSPDDWLRQEIL